ncbi:MAG: hypothetical protein A3C55_00400 [Gammaproteobacteria bacterium RIFCSPHIGHO2_02_FULL_42_13]|nr:MAG: hypothetical protein A3C55_00400 [Gammaproteobacteria bacterium RIFCSPHIGHO2_02_FULL_42_13]OGT68202.1 MAG: hypothetical protein A3H43_04060 [Gammaproteobacteria bacterium RIFCSPLOWO2_02_FULL_42_9]
MAITLSFVFLCILLNTAAQILLKAATNHMGTISFAWAHLWATATQIAFNPYLIIGLSLYVFSVIFWLVVLSRIQVGMAYPLSSLGYITTAIAAAYFLGENFSLLRMIGIFVIIGGVYLVAQS